MVKICKKCVLPSNFPHITFDEAGICNLCRQYKGKNKERLDRNEYKRRFEIILEQKRGQGAYDVLMCYSGGKDSTYAMSLLAKKYKARILALTLDNGFIPSRAYVNIRNVVEKLRIDHIFFKPSFDVIKKIFKTSLKKQLYSAKALERASSLCTSCTGLVKHTAYKFAIEKSIPFIAFGWSPGQAPISSSIIELDPRMVESMQRIIMEPMRNIVGNKIQSYFLSESSFLTDQFPVLIHPLAFFPYNEKKEIIEIKKLGWKKPRDVEMNATNCLINPLADREHIEKYGFHPYVGEIAALVRGGHMSRAEGLRHLPVKKDKKLLSSLEKRLGLL